MGGEPAGGAGYQPGGEFLLHAVAAGGRPAERSPVAGADDVAEPRVPDPAGRCRGYPPRRVRLSARGRGQHLRVAPPDQALRVEEGRPRAGARPPRPGRRARQPAPRAGAQRRGVRQGPDLPTTLARRRFWHTVALLPAAVVRLRHPADGGRRAEGVSGLLLRPPRGMVSCRSCTGRRAKLCSTS